MGKQIKGEISLVASPVKSLYKTHKYVDTLRMLCTVGWEESGGSE